MLDHNLLQLLHNAVEDTVKQILTSDASIIDMTYEYYQDYNYHGVRDRQSVYEKAINDIISSYLSLLKTGIHVYYRDVKSSGKPSEAAWDGIYGDVRGIAANLGAFILVVNYDTFDISALKDRISNSPYDLGVDTYARYVIEHSGTKYSTDSAKQAAITRAANTYRRLIKDYDPKRVILTSDLGAFANAYVARLKYI